MPRAKDPKPNVENYADYRAFLADMYRYKKHHEGHTLHTIAVMAGMQGAASIKHVMDGDRNLSEEAIPRVAKALGLNGQEGKFFTHLVRMNQTSDAEKRQKHLQKLVRRTKFRKAFDITADLLDYVRKWHFAAISQLARSPGFPADPKKIARHFRAPVRVSEVRAAIGSLEALGLLQRQPDGRYAATAKDVSTPDELQHELVSAYHVQASRLAQWAADHVPASERNFQVVMAALTPDAYRKVLDRVHIVSREFLEFVKSLENEATGEMIVQINLQAFPLTHETWEEKT